MAENLKVLKPLVFLVAVPVVNAKAGLRTVMPAPLAPANASYQTTSRPGRQAMIPGIRIAPKKGLAASFSAGKCPPCANLRRCLWALPPP
ncbi:MAG TPA: hypothetical protein VNA25_30665 [Phycisphaerae bacterium]|nr:hypothetical protein [Phycisphaerae bacterium]